MDIIGFKHFKALFIPFQILFFIAFQSCTMEISLDSMGERQIAVECVLDNGPEQTLRLCFAKGSSENSIKYISEADAVLTDLTDNITAGNFSHASDGIWTLGYSAIPGHNYRLDINIPGHDPIYSEQLMPSIDITAEYYIHTFGDSNLYEYRSYPHIVYRLITFPEYTWIYALRYDESIGTRVIAEEICTDYPYVDNFNLTGETYSPEVILQDLYGIPHYMTLAPELIGTNLHNKYLRISKKDTLDRNWLVLAGNFSGVFPIQFMENKWGLLADRGKVSILEEKQGCVVFAGLSADYDRYLREAIYFQQLQESSDLSSIYIRDNIFTNIHGGVGIFGAKAEEKLVWSDELEVIYDYVPSENE